MNYITIMNPTFSLQRQVEFSETDMAGVAHFSNFINWMEATEHAFFKSLDIKPVESFPSGIAGWPKVDITCKYEAPVYFHDTIQINLTIKEVRTHSICYNLDFHKVESDCKNPVARGTMTTVYAYISPHNQCIKSMPMNEDLLNKIKPHTPKHKNPAME